MRVLLIDGYEIAAQRVTALLHREEICVDVADSAEEGLDLVRHFDYDIILTELQLRDVKGLEVIRRLRATSHTMPILVLTASNEVEDKVAAFAAGADDYMTKPFNTAELVSRVRALIRRSRGFSHPLLNVGQVTIDLAARNASVNGNQIELTNMEFRILELLSLRRGTAMTNETVISQLYFEGDGPNSKTIAVMMCKLRKKLAQATGGDRVIETVPQRGYLLRRDKAA
jgi:two-component system, cell cycle response regulator CtrA